MKKLKPILLALLAIILLLNAAVRFPAGDRSEGRGGSAIAAVSLKYREAELVLLAACMRVSAEEEEGTTVSRFTVEEVIEGDADPRTVLSLEAEAVPGEQYLLYLKRSDDTEKTAYELIGGGLVSVKDGVVYHEGETCSLESVIEDIERQRGILTVPSQKYYYGELSALLDACDEVVVGRVLSVSEPRKTVCRSTVRGESTVSTIEQVFMSVRVENGLFGGHRTGEKLEIVLEPNFVRPVINATDLTPKTVIAPPETVPEEGCVYIFFLIASEDVKSSAYFTVNPYEGYVRLIGNAVIHPYYNGAMSEINDLRRFGALLRERQLNAA